MNAMKQRVRHCHVLIVCHVVTVCMYDCTLQCVYWCSVQVDVFYDFLLIPVHLGVHWTLVVLVNAWQ